MEAISTSQKRSDSLKRYWANLSEEERNKRGRSVKAGIHNMSPEAKAKRSRNSSAATSHHMHTLSDDEKARRSAKMSASTKRRYATMSDAERIEIGRRISNGQINMDPIKKREANQKRSESLKQTIQNMTQEERSARAKRVQDWWDNMTIDEFLRWSKAHIDNYIKYREGLSITPNKNESELITLFKVYGISHTFHSYNRTYSADFFTLFPNNPVTKSKFVMPYHEWDFRVYTSSSEVLVDIDGSIHVNPSYSSTHPSTGVRYDMLDYHKFNDSQRPYQTEGLDAYVVQCYDDNLTKDTPVINVTTGNVMSLGQFLLMLEFRSLSADEQRKIVRDYMSTL